jgi:hypothetical protein
VLESDRQRQEHQDEDHRQGGPQRQCPLHQ